jgi:diguanylate cyclase (GGDEF)-like protein
VADALRSSVRETDTAARVGGDEFMIVATELRTAAEAALIANKIVRVVSQPILVNEQLVAVGASVGIALYPDNSEDIGQLIKLADTAMYEVKKDGKNGYRFANGASS